MKRLVLFCIITGMGINGFTQQVISRIDSLMRSYYSPDAPGAAIAIQQNNKTLFEKGYGLANIVTKKPITGNSCFNIGSLTKQFTAYAILELHHQKKLSLSDNLEKYFTGLQPAIASLTISQLLSHSSGIPDHYPFTDTLKVKHATDKDVLEAMRWADTLYFAAGTRYRYSNTAYCLLGLIIEKLSGDSYRNYLIRNIFKPLGMKGATVFRMNELIPDRVTAYNVEKDGGFIKSDAEESIFFSTEADGGLYTSLNNYLKWCIAIENGPLSKTPMMKAAWQIHTLIDTPNQLGYGYGWFIHKNSGSRTIYHTGSNGGFRTVIFLIPSLHYRVCIFSNQSDIDLEDLVERINHILQIPDNSFIKSGPLESFINRWPIFVPCKETTSYSNSFTKNWNAKDMALN